MQHFHTFVIGGGPAGKRIAAALARDGHAVGLAEPNGVGGTCALRGCDPKRVMVTAADALERAQRLDGCGLRAGDLRPDWQQLMARVEELIAPKAPDGREELEEAGVRFYDAEARFDSDAHVLRVGKNRVRADRVVIATGQHPRPLDIPGAAFAKTSDDFHRLPKVPRRVLFVGGGYIALESAHVLRRFGAEEVTLVNADERALPMTETALEDRLLAATEQLGIRYVNCASVTAIERVEGGFRVSVEEDNGQTWTRDVDLVMNASGRLPTLDVLGLAGAGIEFDRQSGIAVDEYLRVRGADDVYAVGDVADSQAPPLTPVATLEADAVLAALRGEDPVAPRYEGLPTAVYTLPQLACVGLTEEVARERGHEVEVTERLDADGQFNAQRVHARAYGYKTVADASSGKLLGAHLLGPAAAETINLFALAIRAGLPASIFRDVPWAYPTWASDTAGMVGK